MLGLKQPNNKLCNSEKEGIMSNIEDNESIKTLGEAIKGIEDLSKISRFFEADIRDEIETIKKNMKR